MAWSSKAQPCRETATDASHKMPLESASAVYFFFRGTRMTYTTREAASRFGEILRQVQAGERIVLVEEGTDVAEIRPLNREAGKKPHSAESAFRELEEQGVILPADTPRQPFIPAGKKPGALARFLESRH